MSSKVYFSRTITAEKVLELYKLLGKELKVGLGYSNENAYDKADKGDYPHTFA